MVGPARLEDITKLMKRINMTLFQGTPEERDTEWRRLCRESLKLRSANDAVVEARQQRVDFLVNKHRIIMDPDTRKNLRFVEMHGEHTGLPHLGKFLVLVTDGARSWVQLQDGRVMEVTFTNLKLEKPESEFFNRPKKPKKPKKLTKAQLALMESLKELGII
jgi:hypothetical protein